MANAVRNRRCVVCHTTYTGERFCPIDGGAIVEEGPDPRVGKTIAERYLIRRLIGRGGMGTVYEADHLGLDKPVAIKFLLDDETDPKVLARFRREARIASKISHPHVVQLYDVGNDGGEYIVMEYLEGRDLRTTLAASAIEPPRAIAIAIRILRGLQAIHDGGIVHRDIKPANILLTEVDGDPDFVKIMDFGISKSVEGNHPTITDSRHVVGTPRYMAPEQLLGLEVDHRADLYAVGLTLFEMIAGVTPFEAASSARAAAQQISEDPASLDTIRADVPRDIVRAVARALAKSPTERFDSATEFAAALSGGPVAVDPREDVTRPSKPVDRFEAPTVPVPAAAPKAAALSPRRHLPIALAAFAFVAVAVILFLVLREGDRREPVAIVDGAAVRDPVAVTDAAIATPDHLALARAAVAQGNLGAAIESYEAARTAGAGPDTLYEIAKLHERLDRRAAAAAAYRRYLEAVPKAADRERIERDIATLEGAPVDAVVPTAPRPPRPKPPRVEDSRTPVDPKQTGDYCRCYTAKREFLCVAKGPPSCRCETKGYTLCGTEFDAAAFCTDAGYPQYVLRGSPGDTCNGYLPGSAKLVGTMVCHACRDPHGAHFRGTPGDACKGYGADGTKLDGTLGGCRSSF